MSLQQRQQIRILHVDDDPGFSDLTKTFLERENSQFTVETANSATEGLELVSDGQVDCIVSDYNMPGRDGLEFLQTIREDHSELPFILFTGKGSESVASEAIAGDVTDYLQKSGGTEQYELLSNRIRNAVQARRTAQAAAQHEELMRLTEYAGDIGGWELDVENETLILTDGTRRLIGLPEDTELSLEEAIELYHPADREAVRQAINSVTETGEESGGTWRLQTLDGEERYLEVSLTPVTTDGDVTTVRGTLNDVTLERERQRELEQTETLFDNAQDAMFLIDVTDESYRFQRVNPAYEQLTGLSDADLSGKTLVEVFGADDAAAIAERYDPCVGQREPQEYVEELTIPTPESYWETRIAPIAVDGTVEYIAGSTRNVTEQRERKQELEAEKQFIEQTLNSLEDLFYVVGPEGYLQRWNDRMPEITGYTESELAGMKSVEVLPEDAREDAAEAIESLRSGDDVTLEADLLTADNQRIPHEFIGGLLTDQDGNTTGFVGIGRDISGRKRRERRFQALVEESSDIISIVDTDGRYEYQSPSLERVLGYDPKETVGDTAWEYIHPDDREIMVETFQEWLDNPDRTETVEYRARHADGSWRWMEARGNEQNDNPDIDGYVINSRDITDQKEDKQKLEKREQTLRELHAATREFYPPSDRTEIAEFLVGFLSSAFEFPYIGVEQFDEGEKCLQPAAQSSALPGGTDTLGPVEPGPNPIWSAYEHGEPRTFDMQQHAAIPDGIDQSVDQGLAFPVGDFGVIVVGARDDDPIDDVARDLFDVVATNAESASQRLRAAETSAAVAADLSTKQAKVEELTTITDIHQQLHQNLASKDTRDALDRSVCDHLNRTDRIDFAWIGRPEGIETNLQPTAWAGRESGYLDEVDLGGDESIPAQRVVGDHEQCSITDIGSHVTDTDWAKHALTAGFRSVISVPLVYDGVLYGVLSAYATEEEGFDRTYSDLVTNAGSLLVSYNRTLANRYEGTQRESTMLEFELSDPAYPFNQLAATTDCHTRVDTVVETTDTEMRLLVTVLDGDSETVFDQASSVTTIIDVDWFGEHSDQLIVSVQKPFLASVIGKHDAVLCEAVSDGDGTSFRVELHGDTSKRPVLDALQSEYQEISPVAQRQCTNTASLGSIPTEEILTDRQREVLHAAFHGGYYETPKKVKGKDIASNFGISNTAVYNHLQASHRRILGVALDGESGYQK